MDPYRGALERCTVRRCSVLGWPVPSLSVPTPLTAANSVQVRGWARRVLGAVRCFPALSWVRGCMGKVAGRDFSANSAFTEHCPVPSLQPGL